MPRKVMRVTPGRVVVRLKPGHQRHEVLEVVGPLLLQRLAGHDRDRRRDLRDGLRALLGGDHDFLAKGQGFRRVVRGAGDAAGFASGDGGVFFASSDGGGSWAQATLAARRPVRARRLVLEGRMKHLPRCPVHVRSGAIKASNVA